MNAEGGSEIGLRLGWEALERREIGIARRLASIELGRATTDEFYLETLDLYRASLTAFHEYEMSLLARERARVVQRIAERGRDA